MNRTLRACNRFGMGATVGDPALADPRSWLLGQVRSDAAALDDASLPTASVVGAANRALIEAQRSRDEGAIRVAREEIRGIARAEGGAALRARVTSTAPFAERLVAFWSNHFCVSVPAKPPIAALAGLYERQVIRPHVFGRFEDMVLASARHPAMLVYLDNAVSIGPHSAAARGLARRGRERGLNENYARELLELHTLGVDGGYAQEDVEALARILTGWTVTGFGFADRLARGRDRRGSGANDNTVAFAYQDVLHEPGDKTLLGVKYGEAGEEEGRRAIADLCRHPSTARFLATKLVRHFVADEPPPEAVDRIVSRWTETDGDLAEVSRGLIDLDEAWMPEYRKFRAPQDWLTAMLRAVGARDVPEPIGRLLQQLRQPLWAPSSPKGYADTKSEWADPDSLLNRAELARSAAGRLSSAALARSSPGDRRTSRVDPERFLEIVDVSDSDPLVTLLADGSIAADERTALVFGGPAFQWR
ncbi:MAG: DUF1800 domain-containing protein [Gemmatimonadetes bacterium]|nr:DUF1800 domain-containing protein [Gemmatimonadota bacterium]